MPETKTDNNIFSIDLGSIVPMVERVRSHTNTLFPSIPIPMSPDTDHIRKRKGFEVSIYLKKVAGRVFMVIPLPSESEVLESG